MFESADAEMRGKWRRPAPITPIGDCYLRYRGSIWDLFGDSFLIGVLNERLFSKHLYNHADADFGLRLGCRNKILRRLGKIAEWRTAAGIWTTRSSQSKICNNMARPRWRSRVEVRMSYSIEPIESGSSHAILYRILQRRCHGSHHVSLHTLLCFCF